MRPVIKKAMGSVKYRRYLLLLRGERKSLRRRESTANPMNEEHANTSARPKATNAALIMTLIPVLRVDRLGKMVRKKVPISTVDPALSVVTCLTPSKPKLMLSPYTLGNALSV